jgi:hypothetical protein
MAPHVHRFIDMHDLGDMLLASRFCRAGHGHGGDHADLSGFDALLRDLRDRRAGTALDRRRGRWAAAWQGCVGI